MPKAAKTKLLKARTLATKAKPVKAVPVMTRVSPRLKAKLKALAKHSERSEAFIARAAIEAFVDLEEAQVKAIKRRLDETRRGAPTVPHAEVDAWVKSLGTVNALPRPRLRS